MLPRCFIPGVMNTADSVVLIPLVYPCSPSHCNCETAHSDLELGKYRRDRNCKKERREARLLQKLLPSQQARESAVNPAMQPERCSFSAWSRELDATVR